MKNVQKNSVKPANVFIVGEVFVNTATKDKCKLRLSETTIDLLIKPLAEKSITIPATYRKITELCLPENADDCEMRVLAGCPEFIKGEDFLLVLYLLIFQPVLAKKLLGYKLQKNKENIFHVIFHSNTISFTVEWRRGYPEWRISDFGFCIRRPNENPVFLYFSK